jgi:hypothetical protein
MQVGPIDQVAPWTPRGREKLTMSNVDVSLTQIALVSLHTWSLWEASPRKGLLLVVSVGGLVYFKNCPAHTSHTSTSPKVNGMMAVCIRHA